MNKGFTLIEIIVVIAIIAILSGIILFSVTQYINMGKDSNVSANLAILVPAGEVFYKVSNSYEGFCDPNQNSATKNAFSQMPPNTIHYCIEDSVHNFQAWAACAQEFANPKNFYCVDSRGMKGDYTGTCGQAVLTNSTNQAIQCNGNSHKPEIPSPLPQLPSAAT